MILRRSRLIAVGESRGWDRTFNTNLAYSGALDQIATASATVTGYARGKRAVTLGKFYFEVTVNISGGFSSQIALLTPTDNVVWADNGVVNLNGSSIGSAGSYSGTGVKTVHMAVDVANRRLWCRVQGGAWSGDPVAGTGSLSLAGLTSSAVYAAAFLQANATLPTTTLRDNTPALLNAPPTGFTPWSSY